LLLKRLTLIYNSAMHLQNLIEDALDINRLENNKFEIFREVFDVRRCVAEVGEIMKF
jgi:signal transduction histidine kinase